MSMLRVFIVGTVLWGLAACDSSRLDDPPLPVEPVELQCLQRPVGDHLVPLATGNTWAMETFIRGDYRSTLTTVVGDTLTAWPGWDGLAFPFEASWIARDSLTGAQDSFPVYGNDGLGLSYLGGVAPLDSMAVRWDTWPYPTEVGTQTFHQWLAYSNFGEWSASPVITTHLVVSTDSLIETPAGSFETVVFQQDSPRGPDSSQVNRITKFYSPGVGLVRGQGHHLHEPEPWSVTLLAEYCLMQPP